MNPERPRNDLDYMAQFRADLQEKMPAAKKGDKKRGYGSIVGTFEDVILNGVTVLGLVEVGGVKEEEAIKYIEEVRSAIEEIATARNIDNYLELAAGLWEKRVQPILNFNWNPFEEENPSNHFNQTQNQSL